MYRSAISCAVQAVAHDDISYQCTSIALFDPWSSLLLSLLCYRLPLSWLGFLLLSSNGTSCSHCSSCAVVLAAIYSAAQVLVTTVLIFLDAHEMGNLQDKRGSRRLIFVSFGNLRILNRIPLSEREYSICTSGRCLVCYEGIEKLA